MAHVSSLAPRHFALLNGHTSADPYVEAYLTVGDRDGRDRSIPQFTLRDAAHAAHGRLTWDADHVRNGSASPFFSVAPVRLDVKADGECLLAVGTADFVRLQTRPYRWIDSVQVAALAGTAEPGRVLQWDLIELVFCYADGRTETCKSNCLPGVATGSRVRRAAQAAGSAADLQPAQHPRQYAEITTGTRDVVGIRLRGQVTLRANDGPAAFPLRPEDLQGQVAVFTDASPRRG
jgi:hypothetical protein